LKDRAGRGVQLRLVTTAEIRPGERVLDVACGKGSSLVPAAVAAGPEGRVVGVDIVPGMVEAARLALAAAGCANGEAVVMDGGALEFPDASFDVVLCANALAFLGMQRALTEFSRVLRPGGREALSGWFGTPLKTTVPIIDRPS
jgi:O-methyltransferase/aklanonic acid methyltransferase